MQRAIADTGGEKVCKMWLNRKVETTAQDLLKRKMSMLFNT